MLRCGMAAGVLLSAVLTGCAVVVPAFPIAMQPAERLSIINLKAVESTVDKSLQETVSISFVPPRAMAIEQIEYRVDGRQVAKDEFDLILQTSKLMTGEHVVSLFVKSDGTVVRGNTHLTIIESGKVPAPVGDSSAESAESSSGADKSSRSVPGASQGSSATNKGASTPKWTGGKTEEKANVAIRIKLPDE